MKINIEEYIKFNTKMGEPTPHQITISMIGNLTVVDEGWWCWKGGTKIPIIVLTC